MVPGSDQSAFPRGQKTIHSDAVEQLWAFGSGKGLYHLGFRVYGFGLWARAPSSRDSRVIRLCFLVFERGAGSES